MQYNSDLRAEVAIVGHALFSGDKIAQHVRPGIEEHAALFADWHSGAALFTSQGPTGGRRVHAIMLYKTRHKSDQATVAALLQADLASEPSLRAVSALPGLSMSTVIFGSRPIPVPLPDRVADDLYAQLYHQFHDGSTS